MSSQHAADEPAATLVASIQWQVEAPQIAAILDSPTRIYVTTRSGNAEHQVYAIEGHTLRETARVPIPPRAVFSDDGWLASYISGPRICISRVDGPQVIADLSANKYPLSGLAWSGRGDVVGATLQGGWPLGLLWNTQTRQVQNLEPERVPLTAHHPTIAISADDSLLLISRAYAYGELFHCKTSRSTITPIALKFSSSSSSGKLDTGALGISSRGIVMMSSVDGGTTRVLYAQLSSSLLEAPVAGQPFWLDPEQGPTDNDPAEPPEHLLRVFPSDLLVHEVESKEFCSTTAFTCSAVTPDSGTFALGCDAECLLGQFQAESLVARTCSIPTGAKALRLSRGGHLLATATETTLKLWTLS